MLEGVESKRGSCVCGWMSRRIENNDRYRKSRMKCAKQLRFIWDASQVMR